MSTFDGEIRQKADPLITTSLQVHLKWKLSIPKLVQAQESNRVTSIGTFTLPSLSSSPSSPIVKNLHLSILPLVERVRYQCLVGKFNLLVTLTTILDYVVSIVSQFMHSPKEAPLEEVYKIIRYLKVTLGKEFSLRRTKN